MSSLKIGNFQSTSLNTDTLFNKLPMRSLASISIFIILAGCVGPLVPVKNMDALDLVTKRSALSLPIYNESQLAQKKYSVMNVVEGISCKNKTWDPGATKINAINQAKYWAYEMGANGLLNIQCDHPRGTTTTYNCWESITCTAQAIKVDE